MHRRFLAVVPAMVFILMLLLAVPAWAQSPDLSITKQGPARVEPGERFVYTIVVRNTGDAEATGVVVTDRLPEGVEFVESDPAICTAVPDPQHLQREIVTCNIGTLDPQESQTIELTVTAPNDVGEIANRATVDSLETEPESSNTVTTTVAPDLVIRKLDDPDQVRTGDLLLYTLRVTNQSSTPADNVVIVDDLPLDQVDLVRLESEDFDCEFTGGLVRCRGDLDAETTGTVEILVRAEEAGTIRNTASVRIEGVLIDTATEETIVVEDDTDTDTDTENTTETTTDDTTTDDTTATEATTDNTAAEATTGDVGDAIPKDVIVDTIPDKILPNTSGVPLLGLAALGLASVVAGASVLRAATRRRR